jgi:oligosaccharide repeat unit polymerase
MSSGIKAPEITSVPLRRPTRQGASGVWWLSPIALIGLVALPTTWLALAITDDRYRFLWGTPKSVTVEWTVKFTIGLLLFIAGAAVPLAMSRTRAPAAWPGLSRPDLALMSRAATVLFWLTVVGYVGYAVNAARVGLTLNVFYTALTTLNFYDANIRGRLGTVPGVTTFTQFGVAFTILAGLLLAAGEPRAKHVRRLCIVLFLALLRAFFVSERLALLELLVPLLVVGVSSMSRDSTGARRASFLPAVILPLVVAFFGAFEYSRSWVFYKAQGGNSFPAFIIERFAGYYVTAYNNGVIRLEHQPNAALPYDLVQAFWTAPGIGSANLFRTLTGLDQDVSYTDALTNFGNPEFNNQGGVVSPFVDLGTAGALVFFLLLGLACGLLYRSLQQGRIWGLVLYPLMVLTLLEMPRYIYLPQGRAAPGVIALVVVALLVHRGRRRRLGATL